MATLNSTPRGVLAVLQAKKAKEREKRRLENAIDADVQKLKSLAEQKMEDVPTNEYYIFQIKGCEFGYENPEIVINTFCKFWENEGFIVPKVETKKNRSSGKKNPIYTIRFRPNEESIRLASKMMMSDDMAGSSSSSTVS
jgi:hypothetical protein